MEEYLTLITAISSGLFGLLVAVVTIMMNGFKDSQNQTQRMKRENRLKFEILYAEHIAQIEKCLRCAKDNETCAKHFEEMPHSNARMLLLSNSKVLEQSSIVSNLLYQWSSELRAGMPKSLGDSGIAIASSNDSIHAQNAEKMYPALQDQIHKMIEVMQAHLDSLDK